MSEFTDNKSKFSVESKKFNQKTLISQNKSSKKNEKLKIKAKRHLIHNMSKKKRNKIIKYIKREIEADPNDFNKMVKYVTGLTFSVNVSPHILDFLNDLIKYTRLKFNELEEILKGAYVIIRNDMGIFYKKYKKFNYMMASQLNNTSSHYSFHPKQPRIGEGSIHSIYFNKRNDNFDLIMGTIENKRFNKHEKDEDKFSTWFQFEESRDPRSFGHTLSTIRYGSSIAKYYVRGTPVTNIGALGRSIYSEYNPLVIRLCQRPNKLSNKFKKLIECYRYAKSNTDYIKV
tara:strand:+ start:3010 stop:3870 length:861 start_codon:yes stop_codon:yes gene_type:complete